MAGTHVLDNGDGSTLPAAARIEPAALPLLGQQEISYYRVDSSRLAGLRARLITALAPPPNADGTPGANARIGVNLSTPTLLCPAGLRSDAGNGLGCIRFVDGRDPSRPARLFDFNPTDPELFDPVFDTRIARFGPVVSFYRPLLPIEPPAAFALPTPQPVSLGPSIDLLADFMPLGRTGPATDTSIDVRFHPEQIGYGSPGHAPRPGLYMPIDLDFRGGIWAQEHTCGAGFDDSVLCPEVRKNLDFKQFAELAGSCAVAQFALRLNTIRVYLMLVPSMIPGCTMPAGNAAADDVTHAWMLNLPYTQPFNQSCLRVETEIRVETGNDFIALASSAQQALDAPAPAALWAQGSSCTDDVELYCEVADCGAIARESSRGVVAARLQAELAPVLLREVDTFLTSDGAAFAAGPPPSCTLTDPTCLFQTRTQLVPASLQRLTFGFFANAFRGMPIVDVQPCEIGWALDGDGPDGRPVNPWDACCPVGTHAHRDGYCAAVRPPADPAGCNGAGVCTDFDDVPLNESPTPCCGQGLTDTMEGKAVQSQLPLLDATYFKVRSDTDGDGLRADADLCPFKKTSASNNFDTDGDRRGDACDVCPCSPDEAFTDGDGDGVCAVSCIAASSDNCPFVRNAAQRNTNADAERYSKNGSGGLPAAPYGDACEPVPVPEFSVASSLYDAGPSRPCERFAKDLTRCFSAVVNDAVTFTPQGTHPTGDTRGQVTDAEVAVEGVETRAYFCVPRQGLACSADQVSGDDRLADTASESENTAVFRFASLRPASGGNATSLLPATQYFKASGASTALVWEGVGDLERWRLFAWGAGLSAPARVLQDDFVTVSGRLWFHAAYPGVASPPLPGYAGTNTTATGAHRLLAWSEENDVAAANLANTYWGGWPLAPKPTLKLALYREAIEVFPVPPCYECGQFQLPNLDDCLACAVDRSPNEGRGLTIPVLVDPFNPLAMAPDARGDYRDVGRAVSPLARAAFATPHRAVTATDPTPTGDLALRRPTAVLLTRQGNALVDTLYAGSLSIGTRADVIRRVEARGAAAAPAPISPPGAGPAPWATTDGAYVSTYNRQQGEVFVVSAKTDRRQAEVWAHDVDEASWSRIELRGSVRLDKPLATVFLPKSKSIWVLDETRAGLLRVARLVRIDRDSGVATIVGSYPRLGLYDTHYLLEDRDGRPLLAASSRLLGLHVLIGLSAGGSISSFGLGQHALASAPIVDDEAYTFLLRTKSTAPVVRRLAHLPMLPGRATEANRCF